MMGWLSRIHIEKRQAERSHSLNLGDLIWASRRIARRMVLSAIPVKAHMRIASLRGRLHRISSRVPDRVRENIHAVYGERLPVNCIDEIASRHIEFQAQTYLIEMLPLHFRIANSAHCRITGVEHLESALERGRGAILATAHFGYARLIGPLLRAKGLRGRERGGALR